MEYIKKVLKLDILNKQVLVFKSKYHLLLKQQK